MSFRLVPKSVTLEDLERRNGRYFAFFPPKSVPIGADYVKVVEDTPRLLLQKCSPNNLVFSGISFMAIFAEVTENECIIHRRLRDIDSLSDSVRPHVQYVVVF